MLEFFCSILIFFNLWNSCEEKETLKNNINSESVVLSENIELLENKRLEELKKIKLEEEFNKKNILEEKRIKKELEEKIKQEEIERLKKLEEENKHIKTPEDWVKSLYYTAYAIWNKEKYNNLLNIVENTWVNSVTIDVKTVTGYISFEMDKEKFWKVKPVSDFRIKNIKEIIKKLHEKNIYVIWRVVVFKDNLLTSKRPDLAYKWIKNKNKVWNDYSWNKYLDANSREVWDYNSEIASQAYEMWFDEINFDYVRFPSDWKISQIYSLFSKEILEKKWNLWKIKVLDNFSNYITKKLKKKHPKIILSVDVFCLVTRWDMKWIRQNLESFLLYFDYVWPMTYPSHYWKWFLWFSNPDNHPYEIIKNSILESNLQIDNLNKEIELSKNENRKIKLSNWLETDLKWENAKKIDKNQIRLWLQGFTCTRCKWATPYNSYKFWWQTKAIKDMWWNSFWVWSSSSRYYESWYK